MLLAVRVVPAVEDAADESALLGLLFVVPRVAAHLEVYAVALEQCARRRAALSEKLYEGLGRQRDGTCDRGLNPGA